MRKHRRLDRETQFQKSCLLPALFGGLAGKDEAGELRRRRQSPSQLRDLHRGPTVEADSKTNGLTIPERTQNHVQIARVLESTPLIDFAPSISRASAFSLLTSSSGPRVGQRLRAVLQPASRFRAKQQ